VLLVEFDDCLECLATRSRAKTRQVPVEICLQFVQQHFQFCIIVLAGVRDVGGIDQHRAFTAEQLERGLGQTVRYVAVAEKLRSGHSDPESLERRGIKEFGVVCLDVAG
jgi:hypothetical protein